MKNIHALALFASFALSAQGLHSPHRSRPHFCLDGEDIVGEDCEILDSPGTAQTLYYGLHRDILEHAAPEDEPESLEDLVLLTTGWTMKTDKYFHGIEVEVDKNSIQNEFLGQKGSGNFSNRLTFFVKGNSAKVAGLASLLSRANATFVVPLNDKTTAVIGSKQHPARAKAMFDSLTDEATDPRGWEFQIISIDTHPWRLESSVTIPLESE
jgi:hypothetical protein